MSKPSLDEIELDIIKQRLDLNLHKWRCTPPDSPDRATYDADIKRDQRRYHHLTGGRWYTFRHADDARQEEYRR